MSEITFNKKEISQILRKASEIQTNKELYGDRDGLTSEELINLAAEVGIDEASVLEAIEGRDIEKFNNHFSWWKGTTKIQTIELVDGEISPEIWDDIIREIRRVVGGIGKDMHTRTSFEWEQRMKDIGYRHISLTPQNGKTRIQYVYNWRGIRFISAFFGFIIPFGITAISFDGVDVPERVGILAALAVGAAGSYLNRLILKPMFERNKVVMQTLMKALRKKLRPPSSGQVHLSDGQESDNNETMNNHKTRA